MSEPLYEAEVLARRAVSRDGRVYLAGETLLLPQSEAEALESAGFVMMGNHPVNVRRTTSRSSSR